MPKIQNRFDNEFMTWRTNIPIRRKESEDKCCILRKYLATAGFNGIFLRRKDNFAWLTAGGNSGVVLNTEIGTAGILITEDRLYVIASVTETPRLKQEELLCELGFHSIEIPWMASLEKAVLDQVPTNARIATDSHEAGMEHVNIGHLRYSLTEQEVYRYRVLGHEVTCILEEIMARIRPGIRELDVVGEIANTLWASGIEPVNILCASDERLWMYRHPLPTSKIIKKICMVSLGASRAGLVVSLTRTVNFGVIPGRIKVYQEAVRKIAAVFIRMTQPGVAVKDALEAAREAYADNNFPEEYEKHHQGGAIGYLPREYRATPQSLEKVQIRQGFCWNPTIMGVKSEETLLAQGAVPENLTASLQFPSTIDLIDEASFLLSEILEL